MVRVSRTKGYRRFYGDAGKGWIIVSNGKEDISIPIGTDGTLLKADSSTPSGLAWTNLAPEFMEYIGNWDASTNTPSLQDGSSNPDDSIGDVYRVNVAGTQNLGSGALTFEIGDFVILNNAKVWERAPGAGAKVTSVNSQIGDVVLDTDDVSEGSTNKYFADSLAKDAVVVNSLAGSETDQSPSVAAVNGSISPLVEYQEKDAQRNSFLKYYVFENNAAVYADSSFAPTQDPSALLRDGWYFKNTTLNSKFNYYFYDSSNPTSYPAITLGETSIYTVMTFDAVSDGPILTIYTAPLGDGNDAAPWYRSRLNYSGYATPGFTPELGKKYLIFGGQEPQVHPELPRIQLNQSGITTVGPLDPSEQVLTMAIGSNSAAAQNSNEWIIERAGCNATSLKYDFEFRILPVQQEVIEADDLSSFPASGEGERVYVAKDTNKLYRWDGAAYEELSPAVGGIVSFDQEIYVAKNGNDSNDGSLSNPFLTVKAAMAAITDASPTKRYCIKVAAGTYVETGDFDLKANVYVAGTDHVFVTRIQADSFRMASDFSGSADNRSGFANCTLIGPCNFDWSAVTSAAGKLYFNNCSFNSAMTLTGHNNISQAQIWMSTHFGNFTVSGINLLTIANRFYNACFMNQHPILPTVWEANGGSCGAMTITTTVNDFNKRCSMFAKSFFMDNPLLVDGPVSYCDYTASSLPNTNSAVNGGQLIPMNPTSAGANTALSNLVFPTAVNNPIIPANSSSTNFGDWGKQWMWSFNYINASTGTDLYLISYPSSFGADSSGKGVYLIADGAGLQADVNGGNIGFSTAAVSGTGVRGRVEIDARELTMNNTKIVDLAAGTASTDAVNVGQLTTAFADRYRADSVALGNGVSTASVTFSSALATADYTITYSLVNTVDANPKFLDVIVTAKSTTGFSVKFHQNTDSANYLLEYICIVHS